MTDEDALLAAIVANPDDDTVRLAFADWLDERGGELDVAWAGFIRGQVRVAAAAAEGAWGLLVAEAQRPEIPRWQARVLERLGLAEPGLDWSRWHRGFPESLGGEFAT